MGLLHCFLGIEAYQEKDGVFIWVCLTYPKKVWRGWLQSYIYSFSCEWKVEERRWLMKLTLEVLLEISCI